MNWLNENVIVFGGGGFLGKQIIKDLLKLGVTSIASYGRSVHPGLESMGVDVICGDIRDSRMVLEACKGRSLVFHTAAKAGVWGRWKEYYGTNVIGTENIINAARENEIKYLIYTSSPSVAYSPIENVEFADESIGYPNRYLSHYPHTKAIAEKIILKANDKQLKTISLRPHLLWGKGDPHLVPRILKRAKEGALRVVGDGTNLVDITHVKNGSYAHIAAAEKIHSPNERCSGNAYFISDDDPVNLWEWVNELLEKNGIEKLTKSISYAKAYNIGATLEIIYKVLCLQKEPPMTKFVAGQLALSHYFNISKAKNDLGYAPNKYKD